MLFGLVGLLWMPAFCAVCRAAKHAQHRRGLGRAPSGGGVLEDRRLTRVVTDDEGPNVLQPLRKADGSRNLLPDGGGGGGGGGGGEAEDGPPSLPRSSRRARGGAD